MKRLIAVLLAALLLCACAPQPAVQAPAETAAPAPETAAPETAAPETAAPETAAPAFSVEAVAPGEAFTLVPQAGGEPVSCVLEERPLNEWDYALYLVADGRDYQMFEMYSGFMRAQRVTLAGGAELLLVTADEMSDDYGTVCWQIRQDGAAQTAYVFGAADEVQADGTVEIGRAVDVLGTWWGERTHVLGADGSLAPRADSVYRITAEEPIVVKAPFDAETEAGGAWAAITVQPGDRLYPTATDNEGTLWFNLNEVGGRLTYSRVEYEIFIGGVAEDELFEELRYAG